MTYKNEKINFFDCSIIENFVKQPFKPHSTGSKEFLNNFKILTGQGFCGLLPCSQACTKTKKGFVVILNETNIFLLMTNVFILFNEKLTN
jgi:hypothetical protein